MLYCDMKNKFNWKKNEWVKTNWFSEIDPLRSYAREKEFYISNWINSSIDGKLEKKFINSLFDVNMKFGEMQLARRLGNIYCDWCIQRTEPTRKVNSEKVKHEKK